jgi:hypothetical protein
MIERIPDMIRIIVAAFFVASASGLAEAQDRKLVTFPNYNPGECLAAFFKPDGTQEHRIIRIESVENFQAAQKEQTTCTENTRKLFSGEGLCYVFCNPNPTPKDHQ